MSVFPNVHRYSAQSLDELLQVVSSISCSYNAEKQNDSCSVTPPLWFRGHRNCSWKLIPSLFRDSPGKTNALKPPTYSVDHQREDYRYHHFRARVNQQFNVNIESKIEWEEIMQHHNIKTRLMDWSESVYSALTFALEPFLDTDDDLDLQQKRKLMSPSIWVLCPEKLNSMVYHNISENSGYISDALTDILPGDGIATLADEIAAELKHNKSIYFANGENGLVDGIVSLSAIDSYRKENAYRLAEVVKRFEFNPFFYILARYYSDGIYTRQERLPPLAIVHPHHSERIRAQHGVFTVMPHMELTEEQIGLQNKDLDVRAMEYQAGMEDCLYEVRITNVHRIAHDLHLYGLRKSMIYPEPDSFAKEIEARYNYT